MQSAAIVLENQETKSALRALKLQTTSVRTNKKKVTVTQTSSVFQRQIATISVTGAKK